MSAKTMSSVTDEKKDLPRQIGCMNGILQIFDRHHFLTGRHVMGRRHKTMLQDAQEQVGPQYAKRAVTDKGQDTNRTSMESSRASYSSSCSSTFSSLDFNRIAQPEALSHANKPESLYKKTQSRDIDKDSMYREARSLSIKITVDKAVKKGAVVKRIDSPRPSSDQSRPKTPKPVRNSEGSIRDLIKDERLALARFSYDGRESRDSLKWSMKHNTELPRLSLDSKASTKKCSRFNFLDRNPNTGKNENAGHNRTSSVVAKLMGLEDFPDIKQESSQNQITYSPRVSQNNAALPSTRFHNPNSLGKSNICSNCPIEQAQRRQRDHSQDYQEMSSRSTKAPTNNRNLSFSIYGEIEERITELQFQKSGKDLRALKQILEAMQKNREGLEDRTGESMQKNNTKKISSSADIVKKNNVINKVRAPISNQQGLRILNPKYHQENLVHKQKTKDLTPKNTKTYLNKNLKNCNTTERSFGMVNQRLQQKLLRIEGRSQPDSGRAKKQCSMKLVEKGPHDRKHIAKAKDVQFIDDQLNELNSEIRYPSNRNDVTSAEIAGPERSVNTNAARKQMSVSTTRERMPAVEIVVTMSEQPSPISVLDDIFYCEDSPSPVKKISTVFQDESPSPSPNPDEAKRHLENQNHSDCTRYEHTCKYNKNSENSKDSVQDLFTLLTEPEATATDHNALAHGSNKPNHRYINKILSTSGLLKDSTFISTTDQLNPSRHVINPDMFHVLEETEESVDGSNGEVAGKNDRWQSNNKIQRRIMFDLVNEILVRKMTSLGLFTSGYRRRNPNGLLKEVYSEMGRACRTPECDLGDEEDEMIRLLSADMTYRDDWVYYGGEVPGLVLDIERLIFKDLINEVVTGEVLHDWPLSHCRKFFSK